jgi:hypothetical protein
LMKIVETVAIDKVLWFDDPKSWTTESVTNMYFGIKDQFTFAGTARIDQMSWSTIYKHKIRNTNN